MKMIVTNNQKMIIGLLVTALFAAIAYYLIASNDASTENSQSASLQSNDTGSTQQSTASVQEFNVKPTTSESFVAELEAEDTSENATYTGTISYDGNDNYYFEGTFGEDSGRFYSLEDEFISCQNDTCYLLATGENGVDTSTYVITEETIDEYRDNARYVGKSDCPAGQCETWQIQENDGTNITLYISGDNKISKAEGSVNDSSFIAEFVYQPVTITRPENVVPSPFDF